MQIITIAGTVGKDAEVRRTQDGDAIAGWSVAVNAKRGGQDVTTWYDVSLFGRRGEALAPYVRKGGKVTVIGELSTREHNGKTYLQVRASEVTLQGGRDTERHTEHDAVVLARDDMEDEIPF